MAEVLICDLEGDNFLDKITTIWCLGLATPDRPHEVVTYSDYDDTCPPLKDGIARLKQCERVVGWNFIGYDYPVIEKFFPGTLRFEQIYDGMVVLGLLEPTRRYINLDSVGRDHGYPKGDFHEFDRYSNEMRVYMERDVTITALEYNRQMHEIGKWMDRGVDLRRALRLEHNVQLPLSLQMQNGFRLDVPLAEKLEMELRAEKDQLEAELQSIHGPQFRPDKGTWSPAKRTWEQVETFTPKGNNAKLGYTAGASMTKVRQDLFNPGSRQQIAYRLSFAYGWVPTKYTDGGQPKIDEDVLDEIQADHPEASSFARYLMVTKMLGQIIDGDNGWLKKVTDEGRVHGYVRSCGCRTHRMSHSRPNMAQVYKKDLRMRACWLPEEGQVLVGVDADGLELRLLACYLYPWDNGAYAEAVLRGTKEDGTDAHSLNQKAIGLYDRDFAKTFFYAMIYGGMDPKLGSIVVEDARAAGKPRPKGSLGDIGKRARAALESGIVGLGSLIAAVKERAKQRKYVLLPDGRPVMTAQRIALNSLLQGAGAVLMKQALVEFHFGAPGQELGEYFHYLANVHDEVQLSCDPAVAEVIGESFCRAITKAGETFEYKVPFEGEAKIGANWAETH